MKEYNCVGLMCGTSMDGIDIAHITFQLQNNKWIFKINQADCVDFSDVWYSRLVNLPKQSAEIFAKTNVYFGHYLGKEIQQFLTRHQLKADLISSHGQTVFHNPRMGYTIQIGSGATIAKETNTPVVCDLRTTDMAYGGQGAPIVPLGERFLFPEMHQFLNIGGISNIAIHSAKNIVGYDVCMGNLLLNHYANTIGLPYDHNGELAQSGTLNLELLNQLNAHQYFQLKSPKSLDADQVLNWFLPVVEQFSISLEDKLATLVEHISIQLGYVLRENEDTLITGGGALNSFLVERIQANTKSKICLPSSEIINFKEALIIAFLGLKRVLKQPNVLASVTGAKKDTINGAVYLP